MYTRRIFTGIKSLLHFDFPHANANDSGLKDETGLETWTRSGSAMFASKYQPSDFSASNAPKFGYRCLYTKSANDFIQSTNNNASFSTDKFDTEIFICPQSSTAGNILAFMNGNSESLALSLTSSRALKVSSSSWSLASESSFIVPLNSWHHVRLQVSGTMLKVFADGAQVIGVNVPGGKLPVTGLRIGGAHSFFDEFVYRDNIQNAFVPTQPAQGVLDLTKIGGFGTGADGEFYGNASDMTLNTHGRIQTLSGVNASVNSWFTANHAAKSLSPGDEVMFFAINHTGSYALDIRGLYAFRRVISSDGNNFIIDSPLVTEFGRSDFVYNDYLYAFRVPNFSNVTVTGHNLYALNQLIAFRCTGNVTFQNAGTKPSTTTHTRNDDYDLSHSDLPDRMISSQGNLIVVCGGTFTADSSTHLGHVKASSAMRPAGYGASSSYDMPVMIGNPGNSIYGFNVLIAARKIRIDSNSLDYGAMSTGSYSGLCYLAGDMS